MESLAEVFSTWKTLLNRRADRMTCKGCIHHKLCQSIYGEDFQNHIQKCDKFEDKSKFTESLCKVGDTVYQTDGILIYQSRINKLIYDTDSIAFDESAIGQSVFLSESAAVEKRKEMQRVRKK